MPCGTSVLSRAVLMLLLLLCNYAQVLDECHHTAKDSPYSKIIEHYDPLVNLRTKVRRDWST